MLIRSALFGIRSKLPSYLTVRMKSILSLEKGAPTSVYLRLVSEHLKPKVETKWDSVTSLKLQNITLHSPEAISRHLVRSNPEHGLYSADTLEQAEIDHWVWFGLNKFGHSDYNTSIRYCNEVLSQQTYLVGQSVSIADLSVYSALISNRSWSIIMSKGLCGTNVERWYNNLSQLEQFKLALADVPAVEAKGAAKGAAKGGAGKAEKVEEGGKFVDLPGASDGNVVVRFPPEASGYLHIGHAKAALLNQYYQKAFNGKLIMRFDDTNPAKENAEFEDIILEDMKLLQIDYQIFSFTSNHFPKLLTLCEDMINKGLAYVDNTDPLLMKEEREQRKNSKNRDNSVTQNLKMWGEMKKGSESGKMCCVRAKINMNSDNGCMRDPTIYRCKNELHPRTKDQYKVYPTYDFACPVVDSEEGVTHALRTTEYHDRDVQYYWFLEQLGMRKPHIWDYSRLNLTNTILSKRHLAWFVENGHVSGWDDPRFPTVRGIVRRGMTIEGLRQFIISQGGARSVVQMSWDKIWTINKKIIDPIAPRYTGIDKAGMVGVSITNVSDEVKRIAKHPKNEEVGEKDVYYGSKALIELEDAKALTVGQLVTMINWGNMRVNSVEKQGDTISSVSMTAELDNTDYKKTSKLTWLADTTHNVPAVVIHYDNLISKAVVGKDEDFKTYVGHQTQFETEIIGDPCLSSLNKGDIIQLQRKGFFICDVPYQAKSKFSDLEMPCILLNIPDGRVAPKLVAQAPKTTGAPVASGPAASNADALLDQIATFGNALRDLKASKADKPTIKVALDKLLAAKKEYKELTGQDPPVGGKPAAPAPKPAPVTSTALATGGNADVLLDQIATFGNTLRDLKASKADKPTIKVALDKLLAAKKEYKELTGQDPPVGGKPAAPAPKPAPVTSMALATGGNADVLLDQIATFGNALRDLKASKADKPTIKVALDKLLAAKKEYKELTGQDPPVGGKPAAPAPKPAPVTSTALATGGNADVLLDQIATFGNTLRDLKASKADKPTIKVALDKLLAAKKEYKELTGQDPPVGGKPAAPAPKPAPVTSTALATGGNADVLLDQIATFGNTLRDLKASKADKPTIKVALDKLLAAKKEYKELTGQDPPVGGKPAAPAAPNSADKATSILGQITLQGAKVRELKAAQADKAAVKAAVDELLALKKQYKDLTGQDPPVGGKAAPAAAPVSTGKADMSEKEVLEGKIKDQGDKVRVAKGSGVGKDEVKSLVDELLKLKADYRTLTGADAPQSAPAKQQNKQQQQGKKKQAKKAAEAIPEAGVTRLGLEAKKYEDLPNWYSQVITKSEMIEYYNVSGCYILRPWAYNIWENIQKWFDGEIKKLGVDNCYFPMFVSQAALEKEKEHIADFAPEVAWVTRSGDSELAEPIAIRPTSETVMYPSYADWIRSHRDLPLKMNQWCNVVRWEFKHPQPFLRTREFLWQEGHTAFATREEATDEVLTILDLYYKVYKDLLAIPTIKGRKTEKEKFAGGDFTTTIEGYVGASGRAIQGATSHHLGQNFSKMFDITFEDPDSTTGEKIYVHQNSWGITTRTIGVMVMVHGDDKGLVLPPRVAKIQVIITPCGISEANKDELTAHCKSLEATLTKAGIKVQGDYRMNYSTGWKFNHWELKGVPLRMEVGPRDMKSNQVVVVRRDIGTKKTLSVEGFEADIQSLLNTIHDDMYAKALKERDEKLAVTTSWETFCNNLDNKMIIMAPFCGEISCEENIKKDSARADVVEEGAPAMGAKSLCIPFEQPGDGTKEKCVHPSCGQSAKFYTLFGRSY